MSQPIEPQPGAVSGLYEGVHLQVSVRPGQAPEWSASQDGKTWHSISRAGDGTCELFLVPDGRIVQTLRETIGLTVRRVLIPSAPLALMLQRAEAVGSSLPVISDRLHQG